QFFFVVRDSDCRIGTAWHKVDIVCLHNQSDARVLFLPRHHFVELGVVVGRFETFVTLLWINKEDMKPLVNIPMLFPDLSSGVRTSSHQIYDPQEPGSRCHYSPG